MGVKGRNTPNTKMSWGATPFDKKLKEHSWSEDAKVTSGDEEFVAYKLFYDSNINMTCLYDIRQNVTYNIPSGSKAKGYILAFKLNTL